MSETFQHRTERLEHEPTLPSPEKHKEIAEHAEVAKKAEQAHVESLVDAREQVAEIAKVEQASLAKEHLEPTTNENTNFAGTVNSELKAITYNRELKNIRRKLAPSERALSKVIHQPVVRVVSEVAGKTISRPSGILGGSVLAFLGTLSYAYLAHHIGFEYNYSVFLLLFVGGFALGLILELIIRTLHLSRQSN